MSETPRETVQHEHERTESFEVWNEVPLVPQTTGMSCWAAAAAMIVGWRERVVVQPQDVARGIGRWEAFRDGLEPSDVESLAKTWGLTVHPTQRLTPSSLRQLLVNYGPLWVGEATPGLHSIVVTGIRGDGTADGTFVRINDPWPVGRGERYVLVFREFVENISAATEAVGEHAQLLHSGGRDLGNSRSHHATHERHVVVRRSPPVAYGTPVELFARYHSDPPRDRSGMPQAVGSAGGSGTPSTQHEPVGPAHVLQNPNAGANTMATIAIDPGHGGTTRVGGSSPNNATGPAGTLEKDMTLAVGLAVRDVLRDRGHTVAMTREQDVNLGLADRAHVARDANADVFVSIHFNGWDDPQTQGTVTFVHEESGSASHALASTVQSALVGVTGYTDRGVKRARFGVLNPSRHIPSTAACLVEVSFLTNAPEEARLTATPGGDRYRQAIATAIADGVEQHMTASAAPSTGQTRFGGSRFGMNDRAHAMSVEMQRAVQQLLDQGHSQQEIEAALSGMTTHPAALSARPLEDRRPFQLPRVFRLPDLGGIQRVLAEGAVAAARRLLPAGTDQSFDALAAAAQQRTLTIGVGFHIAGGFGVGASAGVGLVFAPEGIGVYFSSGYIEGLFAEVEGNVQFTFIRGGISNFSGTAVAASITGFEGVIGGGAILFNPRGEFLGLSFALGAGAGSPINVYLEISQTVTTVGSPMRRGMGPGMARVMGGRSYGNVIDHASRYGPAVSRAVEQMVADGISEDEIRQSLASLEAPAPAAMAQSLDGRRPVTRPTAYRVASLTGLRRTIADAAVAHARGLLPASGVHAFDQFIDDARRGNISIGVGIHVSGGAGLGMTGGVGLVFAPDGLGVYLTGGFLEGFFAEVEGSIQISVVGGGLDRFGGPGFAVTVEGGYLELVGLSALLDTHGNFQGVAFSVSLGVGPSPFQVYGEISDTWVARVGGPRMGGMRAGQPTTLHQDYGAARRFYGSPTERAASIHPDVAGVIRQMQAEGVGEAELHAALDELTATAASQPLVAHGLDTNGSLPTARLLASLGPITRRIAQAAVDVVLAVLPGGGAWSASQLASRARGGFTIGLGVVGSAGILAGPSAGFGLVFSPEGIGYYGSLGLNAGLFISASASIQLTIVGGGIDRFRGHARAVTVGGGEGIVGSLSVLLTLDNDFLGVSGSIGIGVGSPIEIYMEGQRTWANTFALGAAPGRAMSVSGLTPEAEQVLDRFAADSGITRAELDAQLGLDQAQAAPQGMPARALSGGGVSVQLPAVSGLNRTVLTTLHRLLSTLPPVRALLDLIEREINERNLAIGIGGAVTGGLVAGASEGSGLVFARNGFIGVYGSMSIALGAVLSLSATVQITVVEGGIEAFAGEARGVSVGGGELVVGQVTALYDMQGRYIGVSYEAGIGVSLSPVEVYVQHQRTSVRPIAQSASASRPVAERLGPEVVRAVDDAVARGVPDADLASFLDRLMAPSAATASSSRGFNAESTVSLPTPTLLTGWQVRIVEAILVTATGPIFGTASLAAHALRAAAAQAGVTIAIGVEAHAAGGVGVGGSAGLFFGPGGSMGFYGGLSTVVGWLRGAAVSVELLLIEGGPDALGGDALAVSGALQIPAGLASAVVGGSVLLRPDRSFLGVGFRLGLGVPTDFSPVTLYVEARRTYVATVQSLSA